MKPTLATVTGFVALLMGDGAMAIKAPYENCTETANTTACLDNVTTSPTSSSLRTIYTTAPNSSIPSPSIWLYNLTAYVDKKTLEAR